MKKTTTALTLGTLLLAGSFNALAAGYDPQVIPIEGGGYIVPLLGPNGTDARAHTPHEMDGLRPAHCNAGGKANKCRRFQAYARGLNYFMRDAFRKTLVQEELIDGLKGVLGESQNSLAALRIKAAVGAGELALKKSIIARMAAGCEGFPARLTDADTQAKVAARGGAVLPSDYSYIVSTYDNLVGSEYVDVGEYFTGDKDVICVSERDLVVRDRSDNSDNEGRRLKIMYTLNRTVVSGQTIKIQMYSLGANSLPIYDDYSIVLSKKTRCQ